MFTLYEEGFTVPVEIWLEDRSGLEETCYNQAKQLAQLPFLHKKVCLMPDTHAGKGMPIGGVIAAEDVVIPNAVGVDIGCGMAYTETNINAAGLRESMTENGSLLHAVVGDIMRSIPVGFSHHKTMMPCYTMDRALEEMERYERDGELLGQLEAGYYQIGTLGGGNHFIELQEDEEGKLAIMIHSGSRNFGKQVCSYFNYRAKQWNQKWYSRVPEDVPLHFLPVDSEDGIQYSNWMQLSMDFARENREKMMLTVKAILEKWVGKYMDSSLNFSGDINCHHNYAAKETHFGKEVWVHRKGAVSARKGEPAVIPGAMGSFSYVVKGNGNPASFCSSSHGAGRSYSRKGAMQAFSCEQVMVDLKKQGVVLGKRKKDDVAEESRFAYKDIDRVMEQQKDLVTPVKRLKTIGVVKG